MAQSDWTALPCKLEKQSDILHRTSLSGVAVAESI